MKKILIVVENFKIGGVQKSLLNMLDEIAEKYDIYLAAFDPAGEYFDTIKNHIHFVNLPKHYRAFAKPRNELQKSILWFYKMIFYCLAKLRNKGQALKELSPIAVIVVGRINV